MRAYLDKYPEGDFAVLARNRLKRLAGSTEQATPSTPGYESVESSLGLERSERRLIQVGLSAEGFDLQESADGMIGQGTREALARWQASHGEVATGYLDAETARSLFEAGKRYEAGVMAFSQALSVIQMIPLTFERAKAFADIALGQAKTGRVWTAELAFSKALEAAQAAKGDRVRDMAFTDITASQAEAGYLQEALAMVQNIKQPSFRATAFASIALAQAEAGNSKAVGQSLSDALVAARAIEDEQKRASSLGEIAVAQVMVNRARDALATVQEIKANRMRDEALAAVAVAQAEAGDFQGATATARKIELHPGRAEAFAGIARAQARAGHARDAEQSISQAMLAAQEIEHDETRAYRLTAIARAQAAAADDKAAEQSFAEAVSAAEKVVDDGQRHFALFDIATLQADAGYVEGAKLTAQKIEPGSGAHPDVLSAIAVAQTKAGNDPDAMATVKQIKYDHDRAEAFIKLASAQAEAGNDADARQFFAKAMSVAQVIPFGAADTIADIAKAQAEAGYVQEAAATVQAIGNRRQLAEAIAALLIAQPEAPFMDILQ